MRLIFLFIAFALAAGAFFITMHFTNQKPGETVPVANPQPIVKEVPTTDIYVAKQDIPVGAMVKQEMLDIQPWPKHLILPDMIAADPTQPSDIVKMVARTPFTKGEPIIRNKLANDKDPSFLSASLPKGMRVVTIGTDAIAGVGGFIFPGDRVDVLVTHDVSLAKDTAAVAPAPTAPGNAPAAARTRGDQITEVLLPNIRVVAVNQRALAHGGEPPAIPSTISLEVMAADAQRLRLVESGNGRLSLALRSLKDKDENELARPTGVGDLSRLTPPAYFPVLYDTNGRANYVSKVVDPSGKEELPVTADAEGKTIITLVRGVKIESVETSRP